VVIFPVIFGLVIIGALLSGSAHGTRTCDVGYSIGGGVAAANRSQCQAASQPVSDLQNRRGPEATPGLAATSCLRAAALVSRSAIRTNGDLAFPPSAGTHAVPGDTSGMC
jgi:hypothetical protein